MDKYKNYIARTEQDRIQLAILNILDEILLEIQKMKQYVQYNDDQIANNEVSTKITEEVKKIKKRNKKEGE